MQSTLLWTLLLVSCWVGMLILKMPFPSKLLFQVMTMVCWKSLFRFLSAPNLLPTIAQATSLHKSVTDTSNLPSPTVHWCTWLPVFLPHKTNYPSSSSGEKPQNHLPLLLQISKSNPSVNPPCQNTQKQTIPLRSAVCPHHCQLHCSNSLLTGFISAFASFSNTVYVHPGK